VEDFKLSVFSGMNLQYVKKFPVSTLTLPFMTIEGEEILNKALLLLNLETFCFHIFFEEFVAHYIYGTQYVYHSKAYNVRRHYPAV
jgi:hypothetical protein